VKDENSRRTTFSKKFVFWYRYQQVQRLLFKKILDGALDALKRHGCQEEKITVVWVPGSFELPLVAKNSQRLKI